MIKEHWHATSDLSVSKPQNRIFIYISFLSGPVLLKAQLDMFLGSHLPSTHLRPLRNPKGTLGLALPAPLGFLLNSSAWAGHPVGKKGHALE